jgi:hypothetical protein
MVAPTSVNKAFTEALEIAVPSWSPFEERHGLIAVVSGRFLSKFRASE